MHLPLPPQEVYSFPFHGHRSRMHRVRGIAALLVSPLTLPLRLLAQAATAFLVPARKPPASVSPLLSMLRQVQKALRTPPTRFIPSPTALRLLSLLKLPPDLMVQLLASLLMAPGPLLQLLTSCLLPPPPLPPGPLAALLASLLLPSPARLMALMLLPVRPALLLALSLVPSPARLMALLLRPARLMALLLALSLALPPVRPVALLLASVLLPQVPPGLP